jgi:hypothetical protein
VYYGTDGVCVKFINKSFSLIFEGEIEYGKRAI